MFILFRSLSSLYAQNRWVTDVPESIMTILGFDYLKADGTTAGNHLHKLDILDTIVSYLIIRPDIEVELHDHATCHISCSCGACIETE